MKTMKKKRRVLRIPDERWEEVAEKIDAFAAKIAPLYAMLRWCWHDSKLPPTIADIARMLRSHLGTARQALADGINLPMNYPYYVRSGGLECRVDVDECEVVDIALKFCCDEHTYFPHFD